MQPGEEETGNGDPTRPGRAPEVVRLALGHQYKGVDG